MMRRVIIVEDETAAAVNLRSMLATIAPDVEVVAVLESVEESVDYFSKGADADVVFMDIHLADGDSFRIFKSVDIVLIYYVKNLYGSLDCSLCLVGIETTGLEGFAFVLPCDDGLYECIGTTTGWN